MVFDNNNNVTSMYDYFQTNANKYIVFKNANKILILAHKLAYHYTLATLLKAFTFPFIVYHLCTI